MQVQPIPSGLFQAPSFPKKSSLLTCPEYSPPGLNFLILTVVHRLYESYKSLYGRKLYAYVLSLERFLCSLGQTRGVLTVFKCSQCTSVFREKQNQ